MVNRSLFRLAQTWSCASMRPLVPAFGGPSTPVIKRSWNFTDLTIFRRIIPPWAEAVSASWNSKPKEAAVFAWR